MLNQTDLVEKLTFLLFWMKKHKEIIFSLIKHDSRNLRKNEVLAVTSGHKTLGAKWLFELQFSRQSSLYLDSEVAGPNQKVFILSNI